MPPATPHRPVPLALPVQAAVLFLLLAPLARANTPLVMVEHVFPSKPATLSDTQNTHHEWTRIALTVPLGKPRQLGAVSVEHAPRFQVFRDRITGLPQGGSHAAGAPVKEAKAHVYLGFDYDLQFCWTVASDVSSTLRLSPSLHVFTEDQSGSRDYGNAFFLDAEWTVDLELADERWRVGLAWGSLFGEPVLYPLLGFASGPVDLLLPRHVGMLWTVGDVEGNDIEFGFAATLDGDSWGALGAASTELASPRYHLSQFTYGPRLRMHTPDLVLTLDAGLASWQRDLQGWDRTSGQPGTPFTSRTTKLQPGLFFRFQISPGVRMG